VTTNSTANVSSKKSKIENFKMERKKLNLNVQFARKIILSSMIRRVRLLKMDEGAEEEIVKELTLQRTKKMQLKMTRKICQVIH
jgi:hypothetical protein